MSLEEEILRMRQERQSGDILTNLGLGIAKMQPRGYSQGDWKDALLTSVLTGLLGGGMAGFGQARATADADRLTREAMAIQELRAGGDKTPLSELDYSPELSGVVSALGRQEEAQKMEALAQTQALDQLLAKEARQDERSFQLAKRKKDELGIGAPGSTTVNLNKIENKALDSLVQQEVNEGGVENEIISMSQDLEDVASRLPQEDLQSVEGWMNAIRRKGGQLVGEEDASKFAQVKQALVNYRGRLEKGTQTELDIKRILSEIEGKTVIESIPIILQGVRYMTSNIQARKDLRKSRIEALGGSDKVLSALFPQAQTTYTPPVISQSSGAGASIGLEPSPANFETYEDYVKAYNEWETQ